MTHLKKKQTKQQTKKKKEKKCKPVESKPNCNYQKIKDQVLIATHLHRASLRGKTTQLVNVFEVIFQ